jgi:hypothetical protein
LCHLAIQLDLAMGLLLDSRLKSWRLMMRSELSGLNPRRFF